MLLSFSTSDFRISVSLGLGFTHSLDVETFTPEDGARFLLHRAGRATTLDEAPPSDQTLARHISEKLGGLPLALDQAGAYLKATGSSLDHYERIYEQYHLRLLSVRRGRDHPEPVAATWSLSFERVEGKSPAAADLLRVCAFLAADGIGEEIMLQGAVHLGQHLSKVSDDPLLLDEAVRAFGYEEAIGERSNGTKLVRPKDPDQPFFVCSQRLIPSQW